MNTIMISKIYADVRNFRYKSISEMMMSLRRYVPECKFPVYKIKISKKDTMKGTFSWTWKCFMKDVNTSTHILIFGK